MKIAVVIPSYKVKKYILQLISSMGDEVWRIYVVDDACPEATGDYVRDNCSDERVIVIRHDSNKGVGGAVITGYKESLRDGADVLVKVDGDGQMDPSLIPKFIDPIMSGEADYTKGNRFYNLEEIKNMPKSRLFGNAMLSLFNKLSSGYWNIFDPTNGYTAIHAKVAKNIPLDKISNRYFFESDMLFRLNTLRAVVIDIPMDAKYGDEISNMRITNIIAEFAFKHIRNLFKRIFYNYYLRDLSLASLELPIGLIMLIFGVIYGGINWLQSANMGVPTPAGTVMMAAMPMLMGLQFIMAFLSFDISTVPTSVMHKKL